MNNLKAALDSLVKTAQASTGQPQRLTLRRGLRVDVLISGEHTLLQISRVDVQPSDRELKIVLRDWPGSVPASAAASVKRTRYAGRYYLTTRWLTPPPQRDLFEKIGG